MSEMVRAERAYDKIEAINNSKLKHFKRSPQHYLHEFKNPTPSTQDMIFGIAYHAWVLENNKFHKIVDVMDESKRPVPDKDYKTHANADWKRAYIAAAIGTGKHVVTMKDFEKMKIMHDALMKNEFAKELLTQSQNVFEEAMQWNWKKSRCKGLKDIGNPNFNADLKTCQDADPEVLKRELFYDQWDRQAGMYTDGDLQGKFDFTQRLKDFFFIAQEKKEPYGVSILKMREEVLIHGIQEYRELTEGLQSCMDNKVWEGYEYKSPNNSFFEVGLPSFLRE